MLVVLINNRSKCVIVCSVPIPNVFVRNAGVCCWGPEVSINGKICIEPTWQLTRLVPISFICVYIVFVYRRRFCNDQC